MAAIGMSLFSWFAYRRSGSIVPPSVFRLPSSTFCYLFQASSTLADIAQRSGIVRFDQIPSSVFLECLRLSSSSAHLLQGFLSFFDLPRPLVTFAFTQFVSLYSSSFFDLPSLFLTLFDDEKQISSGDQMDDEEQIGPISGDIIMPKKF
jgi:hypothetical protein